MKNDKLKISTKEISSSLKEKNNNWTQDEYNEFISERFSTKLKLQKSSKDENKKEFIFDKEDKNFISLDRTRKDSIFENFSSNFYILSKIFIKKFLTSGTLLIFLAFPLLIGVLLTNDIIDIMGAIASKETVITNGIKNYTDAFIFPTLIITMIFIPTFVVGLRSESLIKRLGVFGVTKSQFNITITLLTLLFTILIAIIVFYPLTIIGYKIANSMFHTEIELVYPNVNWLALIPLFIFSIISFSQIGIFLGMKYKGTKSSVILGYLIIFLSTLLTSYQTGGLKDIDKSILSNSTYIFYEVFRWIFLITPITIIMQGLVLCYSTNESLLNNPEWRLWVIPLAYIFSFSFSLIPFLFNDKWISFSGIR